MVFRVRILLKTVSYVVVKSEFEGGKCRKNHESVYLLFAQMAVVTYSCTVSAYSSFFRMEGVKRCENDSVNAKLCGRSITLANASAQPVTKRIKKMDGLAT